jgi:type IV secretory pathway VirB4 component
MGLVRGERRPAGGRAPPRRRTRPPARPRHGRRRRGRPDLAARLARGETRLFRVGLYPAVHADTDTTLAEHVAGVRALAASLLLDARPATWRQLAGWATCLPLGLDRLAVDRVMDTDAVAAGFPFSSPDLPPPDPASPRTSTGVLYGYNAASSGLVHWDRFAQDNYNAVVVARSGAGKSYLVKLELLRLLYRGIEGFVLDPEGEYVRLTQAVSGVVLDLGAPGVHLNPLDLPLYRDRDGRLRAPADAYTRARSP